VPSIETEARGCALEGRGFGLFGGFKGSNLLLKDESLKVKKIFSSLNSGHKAYNDFFGLFNGIVRVMENGSAAAGRD
jgi:hypothetical protein